MLKLTVLQRVFSLNSAFILFFLPVCFAPNANGQILGPMQQYTLGGPQLAGPTRVAVADINGDGKLDLLAVTNGTLSTPGTLNVLLGNGNGTFKYFISYNSGGYGTIGIAVADVNGDGNLDVVVTNAATAVNGAQGPGNVAVFLGNGDGSFRTPNFFSPGFTGPGSVAIGDVNRDGNPDLVVGGDELSILLGNGDGTFQTAVAYNSAGYGAYVALADLNEDGKLDIALANRCTGLANNVCAGSGPVGVLLGNGDGTFQPVVTYDSGGENPLGITVADVNGDGIPDLLAANILSRSSSFTGAIGVLLGNGDGTFRPTVSYPSGGTESSQIAAADMNGDGKLDLITFAEGPGNLDILLGDGDGTFQPVATSNPGLLIPFGVAVGDFNQDGKPDIVVADITGFVGVIINDPEVIVGGSVQQPLTTDTQGNFVASVTITNRGNVPIVSAKVTAATLGSASMLSAPLVIANLEPGASVTISLKFPANAFPTGTKTAPLRVSGSYSAPLLSPGGNWALTFRSVTL